VCPSKGFFGIMAQGYIVQKIGWRVFKYIRVKSDLKVMDCARDSGLRWSGASSQLVQEPFARSANRRSIE
jgi:hypothetical protein